MGGGHRLCQPVRLCDVAPIRFQIGVALPFSGCGGAGRVMGPCLTFELELDSPGAVPLTLEKRVVVRTTFTLGGCRVGTKAMWGRLI